MAGIMEKMYGNQGGGGSGGDSHNKGSFLTPTALREAYPTAQPGDFAIVESTDTVWVWDSDGSQWKDGDTKGQVTSVNNQTGAVTLTASDVGAATAAQGAKADTAVQPGDLATVATTGAYSDLTGTPTIPAAIQVSTIPTAAASELGKIYQFIGTTGANYTHGYFYECVSDGQDPATYSWTQTDVQPQAGGLPSQTGQSGKFLTTDGTDASWATINALQNTATSPSSLTILGNVSTVGLDNLNIGQSSTAEGPRATAIGVAARSWYPDATALGYLAKADKEKAIAIGAGANVSVNGAGTYGIAIGYSATVTAGNAIQIGGNGRTNSESGTLCIGSGNNNYKLLDSDGTIPADRLPNAINKYSTMPTAASTNVGWIVQFTGTTDSTYTHGYIYECKAQGTDPETYAWEAIEVQAGGGGGGQNIQVSTLPTASATEVDNIYQFIGASGTYDGKYLTNGYFYKCENNSGTYSWNDIPTMRIQYFAVSTGSGAGRVLVGAVDTYAARCTNAVIIGNGAGYSIAGTPSNWYYSVIVGQDAKAHSYCVSIGCGAVAGRSSHIAIGYNAKNTTTSYNAASSINIGGGTVPGDGSVAIGSATNSVQTGGTAVGNNSKAGSYAVAVGSAAEATGGSSIAIKGKATASNAIQLGGGTNSEANTLYVDFYYNSAHQNYKLLDADGTIPEARLADTTSAQQGDVLTLDSNGNAVWQAGGGGGGGATATTATLATANWSSNSQTVSVTGVTASNVVYVMAAPASAAEYAAAGVQCTAQASGTLTFTCTTTPSSALTVNIAIF